MQIYYFNEYVEKTYLTVFFTIFGSSKCSNKHDVAVAWIYCITFSKCDMKNICRLSRDVSSINVQISVTQTAASYDCPTMFVLST